MKKLITALFSLITLAVFAQKENRYIREGNEQFRKGNITAAESNYKKALEKNKASQKAQYNLGNAYYKQDKFEDAEKQFKSIAEGAKTPAEKSKLYHNLGNSLLQQKKYEESIKAYKQALKMNPGDEDTRYNLAYAQTKLQQQQQQQKEKEKEKEDKKDQDKDKKDQEKDKDKKDDKKGKDQEKEKEKEKEQQGKQGMSEQDAKRMLEAINQEDKKINDKLKKEKAKGRQVQIEKDW